MTNKTNAFDTAQDIIDATEDHFTRDEVLARHNGDILKTIDSMISLARIDIPEENLLTVRARLSRYLRH